MFELLRNFWYKFLNKKDDYDDEDGDDCECNEECDDEICSIILYVDSEKNVSFNYSFSQDYLEDFVELFVNMTTGTYSESLYKMIMEQMINRDINVAKEFSELCTSKMQTIMKEKTKSINDPVVDPLMAFMNTNEGNQ